MRSKSVECGCGCDPVMLTIHRSSPYAGSGHDDMMASSLAAAGRLVTEPRGRGREGGRVLRAQAMMT